MSTECVFLRPYVLNAVCLNPSHSMPVTLTHSNSTFILQVVGLWRMQLLLTLCIAALRWSGVLKRHLLSGRNNCPGIICAVVGQVVSIICVIAPFFVLHFPHLIVKLRLYVSNNGGLFARAITLKGTLLASPNTPSWIETRKARFVFAWLYRCLTPL